MTKIAVLSDIHGNVDALIAVEAHLEAAGGADRVLILGDLVDYGPEPAAVIQWARERADHVVRGNHDHAVATGQPCRSSPAFLQASIATRAHFAGRLPARDIDYLRALPLTAHVEIDGLRMHLVHACPSDALFFYIRPDAPECDWAAALQGTPEETDLVLVGHTHLPFVKQCGRLTVVNPGSVGQPKDGQPHASYATIEEDGRVRLQRVAYDVERAVSRLMGLDLPPDVAQQLVSVLRSGGGARQSKPTGR